MTLSMKLKLMKVKPATKVFLPYSAAAGTSPLLGHFANDGEGTKNTTTKQSDVTMSTLCLMPAVCQLYFAVAECHPFWAVSLMTESKL